MSDALRAAIYNRLAGVESLVGYPTAQTAQTDLVALLGSDTNNGAVLGPAILRKFADEDVSLPQIVFWEAGATPSLQGVDVGIRNAVIVDFGYYERIDDSGESVLAEIDKNVEILLHLPFMMAPLMALTAGKLSWHEGFTEMQADFDEKANLRFGLRRFIFEEARYY